MNFFSLTNYDQVKLLGRGSFGEVHHFTLKETSSNSTVLKDIAVKKINKLDCGSNVNKDAPEWREIDLLANLRHPNVVQFHGVAKVDRTLGLVMEYCRGGDLQGLVRSGRFPSVPEVQYIALHVVTGLEFLHRSGVIHRDIKPQNVLLQIKKDENDNNNTIDFEKVIIKSLSVKISDFGLAKAVEGSSQTMTIVGSPLYAAPEVLGQAAVRFAARGRGRGKGRLGLRADVYSTGLLVYDVMTKGLSGMDQLPEDGRELGTLILESNSLPPQCHDFLSSCLQKDPKDRLTSAQLLAHPFLREQPFVDRDGLTSLSLDNNNKGDDTVFRMHLTREETLMVLGMRSGLVATIDLNYMTMHEKRMLHTDEIWSLCSSREYLVVGSKDRKVSIWNNNNDSDVIKVMEMEEEVCCVRMNGRYLVVGGTSRSLLVYSLKDWSVLSEVMRDGMSRLQWILLQKENIITVFDYGRIKQYRLTTMVEAGGDDVKKQQIEEISSKSLDKEVYSMTPTSPDCSSEFWVGSGGGSLLKVDMQERKVKLRMRIRGVGSSYPTQIKLFGKENEFLLCRLWDPRTGFASVLALEMEDIKRVEDGVVVVVVPFRQVVQFGEISSDVETLRDKWMVYSSKGRVVVMDVGEVRRVEKRTQLGGHGEL